MSNVCILYSTLYKATLIFNDSGTPTSIGVSANTEIETETENLAEPKYILILGKLLEPTRDAEMQMVIKAHKG